MLLGVLVVALDALRIIFTPWFKDLSIYGMRDWDEDSALRYITALDITRYHELPWWHPWLCGGFPAWANSEGANNLVSPYLPFYLVFPIQVAVRLECIAATAAAFVFTYLLAGRVTRSAAIRALVAVAYAFNGRHVLQLSEGHMWHLQYAWVPLALYFFDRSIEGRGARDAIYLGGTLALMLYMGGIYPLPQAVLLLGLYALSMSLSRRSARPFASLALGGAVAVGLAAPKLLVVADMMSKYPRKIDSPEAITWEQLRLVFTDATGTIGHDPVRMPSWGWHEYGIYVGVWFTGAMVLAVLCSSAKGSPTALRFAGLVFLVLGCGALDQYAPWTLLHRLPLFSSQHVPSRALMIAVLALGLAFASLAGRVVDRAVAALPWLDCLLLVPVFFVATDIAAVGELSSRDAFQFKAPAQIPASAEFHHVTELSYRYDPDWHQSGRQELLSMFANTGVIQCHTAPRELVPGAIAQGAGGYRGEAYLASDTVRQAPGTARVTSFTPNTATLHYEGAVPGSMLVYNMNYDPSWRTNVGPVVSYRGAAAVVVTDAAGDVRFSYYPRALNGGLALFAITAALVWRRLRRERGRTRATTPAGDHA